MAQVRTDKLITRRIAKNGIALVSFARAPPKNLQYTQPQMAFVLLEAEDGCPDS